MYENYVINAVRDHLEAELALPQVAVVAEPDAAVHPDNAAPRVITVYPGTAGIGSSTAIELGSDLVLGFNVGITYRVAHVPIDRFWNGIYAAQADGVAALLRMVHRTLARDRWVLLCRINTLLEADAIDARFVEPFRYQGDTAQVVEVGPEHFNSDANAKDIRNSYGLWTNMVYGGGRVMESFLSA